MRILIAAGGTGGHIYPALAVVSRLRERRTEVDVRWIGGRRGLESTIVPAAGVPLDRLLLRSLRTVDASLGTLLDPVRLGLSFPQALVLLGRWRPAVVYTTGGYAAIPILAAAGVLRIPALLWEGNVIPGRSVRATSRLAGTRAASFAESCRSLPEPCYVTGTPIRDLATIDRAAARAHFGLDDAPCILVFGGSQAVRRFNDAVHDVHASLVRHCSLIHVTGESAYRAALHDREELAPALAHRYLPFPFLGTEMAEALAAADLVVGRAGSSTLAEVTALGLPLIVVPYPHAAAHQAANARVLADAGAAKLVPDEEFDGQALLGAAALLEDSEALGRMRDASRRLGRPGAADANVELLLALADRRSLPSPAAIERLAGAPA